MISWNDGDRSVDINGVAGAGVDYIDGKSGANGFGTTGVGAKWCKSFVFVRLKLDGGAGIEKPSAGLFGTCRVAVSASVVGVPRCACAALMIVCACGVAYSVPLSM